NRALGFPREWRPMEVRSATDDQMVFTPEGAWHFIADKLEEGHSLEEVVLNNPKGKHAYVMKIHISADVPHVYVKLQLENGKAIARSFHYSDKNKEQNA
ncbi:hypothetical protein LCGC14_2606840, partial [marine sediment metagenome]